ncbi:MAG: hypothetical protein ACRBK7_28055 [Acidimicrobiales bacterium]
MTLRGKIPALLFALAMVAAACGDASPTDEISSEADEQPSEAATPTSTSSTVAETTTAPPIEDSETQAEDSETDVDSDGTLTSAPIGEVELVLLDAGAEPRTELRMDIPDGTTQTMVMEQQQTIVQEVGGQVLQEIETSTITKAELVTATVEGGYLITSTIVEAEAAPDSDPAIAAQMTAALQASVGITSQVQVDYWGNLLSNEIGGTEGLDTTSNEVVQSTSQLSAPLPTDPVGVGARWELTQPLDLLGINTTQTTVYTLTAIDGPVLTLEAVISQTVEEGSTFEQGGMEIEVVSWLSTGEGNMQVDLSSMVPTSTAISSALQELALPGSDDVLKQSIDVVIKTSAE